jgi:hypothetical protein
VQGISTFGVVLAGTNFAVQSVRLEDFDFGGVEAEVQLQVSQPVAVVQATAGEYIIQITSNRFQLIASGQPTESRIDILKRAALGFADEYASKRGIQAVGHNFTGDLKSALGTGTEFMKHIAWPADLSTALGVSSTDEPVLSLVATSKISEQANRTIRLEPLVRDDSRVFYDLNFNWGQPDKPLQIPLSEVLDQFQESVRSGTELIDRIAALGSDTEVE